MRTKTKHARVLPADVYDALEFSALAFGGIGGDQLYDETWDELRASGAQPTPRCCHGHARVLDHPAGKWHDYGPSATQEALFKVGIDGDSNDDALAKVNGRKGRLPGARVTFREWCKALNVVRGA